MTTSVTTAADFTEKRVGSIKTVEIKDIWPKEDKNFTPWLQHSIGELGDAVGLRLTNPQREAVAGAFSIDLLAETDSGDVVIENQFGKSDHRHLGQLVTYLSEREVQRAIWIVEEARPEHIKAVQTLNASRLGQIWMVKVRAIRIVGPGSDRDPAFGASAAAPLFTVVAEPSDTETPDVIPSPDELTPIQEQRHAFMAALFDQATEEGIDSPFKHLAASIYGIVRTPAKGPQLLYGVAVNRRESRVFVTNAKGKWQRALPELRKHREVIDKTIREHETLRGELEWDEQVNNKGLWTIRYTVDANCQEHPPDPEKLRELNKAAAVMQQVFDPHIRELHEHLQDRDPADG